MVSLLASSRRARVFQQTNLQPTTMPSFTDSQEHFFGIELTKDKPTYTWTFNEEEEDDDADFMVHTLFLKNAILGAAAVKGERNMIQIETKNFEKSDIKQPFLSLTLGQIDMCNLDVSFGNETPVTFRLVEGNGPIALGGQHLVEFPPDDEMSQDESALEEITEDDEEEEEEEEPVKKTSKKRKAPAQKEKATKKGKVTESSADDSVEDEEEDDDDEDDDEEEDMEEDEPKKKKGKTQKSLKTTKVSPTKAATKKGKKAGKK